MDEVGRGAPSRVPLMLRIGEPEPERLAGAVERLCGEGYLLETARRFAQAERVRLILTLRAEPEDPLELEGEVLRRVGTEGEARAGVVVWIPPDRSGDRARLLQLVRRVRDGQLRATRLCRVLVVEDNALVRRLYAQALERVAEVARPLEVLTEFVENGAEAHERLRRRPMIDLVLADLYMPVVDGFELLRRMQAEPALRATPVVVLTAGGPDAAEQAEQLGAEAVLRKPVRVATIVETVGRLLHLPGI